MPMPKPRRKNQFRGFRKVSGAVAGNVRVKVYQCRNCGMMQPPGRKPVECMDCGHFRFTVHDSTGEAKRWASLCVLEKAGRIKDLRRQVRFDLMAARVLEGRTVTAKVGQYIADFVYVDLDAGGEEVIEDYKGNITDLAAWKIRHMEAMGFKVKLTGG